MRVGDYVRVAGKSLYRKPVRTGLTLLALFISTMMVVVLLSLSLGTRHVVRSQLGPTDADRLITVTSNKLGSANGVFGNVQVASRQNVKLTDDTVQKLMRLEHVADVSPRSHIWEFSTFSMEGNPEDFVAQAEGVGQESDTALPLAAGKRFTANAQTHEVVLGMAYVKEMGLKPAAVIGKKVTIATQNGYRGDGATIPGPTATSAANNEFNKTSTKLTATVVGVTASGPNQSSLFIPEGWARLVRTAQYWEYDPAKAARVRYSQTAPYDQLGNLKMVDQVAQDGYSSIVVRADDVRHVPAIAAAIDGMGLGELSNQEITRRITTFSTLVNLVLGAIAVVALTAASLGITNTLLMMVSEQRYAIGVWRACGASRGLISRQFLLQSALIGLLAGVLGAGAGYAASVYIIDMVSDLLRQQQLMAVAMPRPSWGVLLLGFGLSVVFSLLAGAYPAMKAARSDTIRSLASGQ